MCVYEKYKNLLQVEDRAANGEVSTPVTLVNEMLDKLPEEVFKSDTTTFLDPSFGSGTFLIEIVKRLRKEEHSIENIQERIYGTEISHRLFNKVSKLFSNYNFHKLYKEDFLTKDFNNMKFDVIIGNPPYQSGKGERGGSTSLWRKFVKSGFSLLKNEGRLTFVVPGLPNSSRDLGELFQENQLEYVATDVSKHFPSVGTTATYWCLANRPAKDNTYFIQEDSYIQVAAEPLPNIVSKTALSILEKIKNIPELDVIYSKKATHLSLKITTDIQSPVKSEKYKFRLRRTIKDTVFTYSIYEPEYYYEDKLSFTMSGNSNFLFHKGTEEPIGAIKHMSGAILCSEDTYENMVKVFESKLSKFFLHLTRVGGMNGHRFIRPQLDYNKNYTDADLYKLYNLTEEETNLIESTVA